MVHRISVSLVTLLCVSAAAASGTQENRQTAVKTLGSGCRGQGGRDRLAEIRSFAIAEKDRVQQAYASRCGRWQSRSDSVRTTRPLVGVPGLPSWADGLFGGGSGHPKRAGLDIVRRAGPPITGAQSRSCRSVASIHCFSDASAAVRVFSRNVLGAAESAARGAGSSRTRASRSRRNRARGRARRFLSRRQDASSGSHRDGSQNDSRAPRPRGLGVKEFRTFENRYTYDLDDYHDVAGIQVPARVGLGGDPSHARVEINPDYGIDLHRAATAGRRDRFVAETTVTRSRTAELRPLESNPPMIRRPSFALNPAWLAVLVMLGPATAWAQHPAASSTGTLVATVREEGTGMLLPAVSVTARSPRREVQAHGNNQRRGGPAGRGCPARKMRAVLRIARPLVDRDHRRCGRGAHDGRFFSAWNAPRSCPGRSSRRQAALESGAQVELLRLVRSIPYPVFAAAANTAADGQGRPLSALAAPPGRILRARKP